HRVKSVGFRRVTLEIPAFNIQTERVAPVGDGFRRKINTLHTLVMLLRQLQKKAMRATCFKQGLPTRTEFQHLVEAVLKVQLRPALIGYIIGVKSSVE